MDKSYFKNLVNINIPSNITEDLISLKVQLLVLVHNKNQVFDINRTTGNLSNIPMMETVLATA